MDGPFNTESSHTDCLTTIYSKNLKGKLRKTLTNIYKGLLITFHKFNKKHLKNNVKK